jgi:hypothetical protein
MDDEIPLDANGPAYTSREDSEGVPLAYVAEKLGRAIEERYRYARSHPDGHADLLAPLHFLIVAHLGLHNMLAKANDRSLPARLLNGSVDELRAWLALIEREGDVAGLAGLDQP